MRLHSILLGCLGSVALSVGGANAHPCKTGTVISGSIAAGATSDSFVLVGQEGVYTLGGLVFERPANMQDGVATLHAASDHVDRYGRLPVFVFLGERFVQGALLKSGKAVADPTGLDPNCAAALLDAESKTNVVRADDLNGLEQRIGQFTVIGGKVLSIGDRERVLYLNFGANWAQDFTVSVAKTGPNRYQGDIAGLQKLAGHEVTVRGLLEMRRGPLLRLTDESRLQRHD